MSELKTKTIQRVEIKSVPWGNQGYFSHKYHFTDNTKGEAYKCKDPNPAWMKAGKVMQFEEEASPFPNCPFILTLEDIEKRNALNEPKAAETFSQNTNPSSNSKYNGKGGYKSSGWVPRYEDSPEIWLKKQIFISMLKLYEVFSPLVIDGKIKYEDLSKEVDIHLELIMEKSKMRNLPVATQVVTPNNRSVTPAAKHIPVASDKKDTVRTNISKVEQEIFHTSKEPDDIPNVNPEAYSNDNPELFAQEEEGLSKEPAPKEILEKISKCTKLVQLKKIHQNLTIEQLKNKGIVAAYFEQKNKLTKKK